MKDQELQDIWKKGAGAERIELDQNKLINEIKDKMKAIDNKIRRRDRRETIACVIGIVLYSGLAFSIPFFWSKIACVLFILWFFYVIYRLRSTRKHGEPDLSLPLTQQLEKRKNYLQMQEQLLNSVVWWYILPPFLLLLVFYAGFGHLSTWDSVLADLFPKSIKSQVGGMILVAIFFAYVARMNMRSAKRVYPPLIKAVEDLQKSLDRK